MPHDDRGAPTGAGLRESKQAMRARIAGWRDALDPAERAARSAAIAAALVAHPSYAGARAVLLTAPFRSEWDARSVLEHALASGRDVALPRVDAARRMLELLRVDDPARDLVTGFQGIPEPAEHCPRADLAALGWALVPGIAFDGRGRRLGYGGGYYDRLLPLLPRGGWRAAGAFDGQWVERVPAATHDARVDLVVTESGVRFEQPPAR